ncbi:Endonuclease/Exonuclease/phosphatase family protein [Salegentibacter agarivorans]|uniref:Endonuclease/Exonuclease/phosphatase family protein n=1 Tax=Salegentibacter agarivorans TaxID=345907 RepID=A0A1I2MW41_9FLAO|nr:endonuclease/exonuclease/phosphatase family protein [Salegentibacter agarivorans]SFF95784.1 Endonuclease/Exonuclease/phosphatase family protein [Salegentibacter agarivorans]
MKPASNFSETFERTSFVHHEITGTAKKDPEGQSLYKDCPRLSMRNLWRTMLMVSLFFVNGELLAQIKVCSWNIQHLGKTKSASEIEFIANTLRDFDIVALQEVVAGNGGAKAVARLADALNRKGVKWDYVISEPTESTPYATERYAYLWRTSRVKGIREAWLEQKFESKIDREPYIMDFIYKGKEFTLVNFHAIPKKKQPETEVKYFKFFPSSYSGKNLIYLGDFNLPQSHTVFNPLKKMGYKPALIDQKTTMKMQCTTETCLASEYDNIFYNSAQTEFLNSGVVLIYKSFPDMVSVRRISDHIPVWLEFDLPPKSSGGVSTIISNN